MSAELEVLFSDAQETLEQIELECHTLDPVILIIIIIIISIK